MKMRFLACVFCFFAPALCEISTAQACDLCAIYSAAAAMGRGGHGFNAGFAEQFTHYGTLQNKGATIANPAAQFLDSSVTQIFSSYEMTSHWSVQWNLPVIERNFRRSQASGIQTGNVFGIGDISLTGHFTPYEKFTEDFSFQSRLVGGIKFPTGSTDYLKEELAETDINPPSGIHGHDLTLGSGSFDGIVGAGFYVRWHRFLNFAEIQYAIRSTGDFDYRFANDLFWKMSTGAYLLLRHTSTLALLAKISGEHKGLDTLAGVAAEDTGLTSVYMGPDFLFTWKEKLSAGLGADIPVLMNATALQIVSDYRLHAAFTWHF